MDGGVVSFDTDDALATAGFVAPFEGYARFPYFDPVGVETIGYGETDKAIINKYRHTGISEPDARALLAQRLVEYHRHVERCITAPLTRNQRRALTSFVYNVGPGGVCGSTLQRVLNSRDYAGVRAQLMRWNKGGGQVLPGLTRRRKAEADLFETPDPPPPPPPDPLQLRGRTLVVRV